MDTGPDLSVILGSVRMKNPILTASGTCGYGPEYSPFVDLSRLGGFTTKSVTVQPRDGNPPQRIAEASGGMLNAIGLANVGLERFCAEKIPGLRELGAAVFVNVAGHSIGEYVRVCERLDGETAIAGLELNVSCPNVADGLSFGTDGRRLGELVSAVRRVVKRSLLVVKLTPNVTDISVTARAAVDAGAEGLSLVNTFLGMAIDIQTWRPKIAAGSGGYSGPSIKPLAIHQVNRVYREVARASGIPIIGMGGVARWEDAVEFMLAGASAVAVGTALFVDPSIPIRIIEGLSAYLGRRGLSRATDLIGGVLSAEESACDGSPDEG